MRKIDVFFPVGFFVQTLGAGGNVVDLARYRLQAIGLDGQKIAFGLQGIEQRVQIGLNGGLAPGDDDVARRVAVHHVQYLIQ